MRDGRTEIYLCLSLAYFPHLSACAAFLRAAEEAGGGGVSAHSNRRHFERSTVATDCGVSAKPIEKFRVKRRGTPENNNAGKRLFAERENDRRAAKQRKPSENNETELRDERLSLKLSGILKTTKPCGSAKLHRAARKTSPRGKTGKTPAARQISSAERSFAGRGKQRQIKPPPSGVLPAGENKDK